MATVPVLAAAKRSYGFLYEYRGHFVAIAWPWLLGLVALNLLVIALLGPQAMGFTPPGQQAQTVAASPANAAVQIALFAASAIIGAAVAVAWHRTLLLGPEAGGANRLKVDARALRYFGYVALVNLAAGVLGVSLGVAAGIAASFLGTAFGLGFASVGLSQVFVLIGLLFGGYLAARWTILFPAVAIDDPSVRLQASWEATRGNGWRILAGTVLVMLPLLAVYGVLFIPAILLVSAVGGGLVGLWLAAGYAVAVQTAMAFLTGVLIAGFMSLCYDVLIRGGGPQSAAEG